METEEELNRLMDCAEIHRSLHDHPNILKVLGIHVDTFKFTHTITLLLEKAEGSLRDVIGSAPNMPSLRDKLFKVKSPREVILDIFNAIAYVHSRTDDDKNRISHRDIKPDNILLVSQPRDGTLAVKTTDFDSSKVLDDDEKAAMIKGVVTQEYLDPNLEKMIQEEKEVQSNNYSDHDVFGCGIVAFQVLDKNGDHLFKGATKQETIDNMKKNNRTKLVEAPINELAKNCIWSMTQPDPKDRITMDEAKAVPYFDKNSKHILALNAVNEAIIDLGDTEEAKSIKEKVNESFFMLFKGKWQDQEWTFVIPEVMKASKYSNSLDSFLRYCRNLMAHAGQHKATLEKYFCRPCSDEELLEMILERVPRMVVHFYWFAKRHLPNSAFTKNFPEACAKAYEDLMEIERKKISDMKKLREEVCPELDKVPTATTEDAKAAHEDHEAVVEAFFQTSHKEIQAIIKRTEVDCKSLKQDVKKWENDKRRLEKTIANANFLQKDKKRKAIEELDVVKNKLNAKWYLDYRDHMQDADKYRESKE